MDGVLNIRKEKGFTSFDVVAKLRGILHMKKIGHTGTLDPEAEGVLPVVLGKATKLVDLLTDKQKTYEALMHLGLETDTQDMTGTVLCEKTVEVSEEEVEAVIRGFVGEYKQIPPMYSALKVDGKKLYELAREGKTVERKARTVHFYEIDIKEINLPYVRFSVTCSKGTYIRTLCHDIGQKLGCGGCMEELIRIIQQDVVEFPQVSVSPSVSGIPDTDMTLDNIFAIYACIRKAMINASDSTICLCTPEISLEHLRYLVQIIHEVPYRRLEHLFPLLQNQTTENTLDNLRKICSLKPAMNYENYKPFYYYVSSAESEAKKAGLLPNWLITDHIAIGINFHTAKGIILRDAQQIQLLKNSFIQERKIAKEMLFCSDLNAYVKDVNVMMNEGYVTHNYYIEYSPCLLHLIPLNVLKQQIILDGVEKEQLLSSLFQRIRHMETESMVHIFCISGLRQLMEQGRIAGYPDMLYKPLDPAMRLWLLKSYYQYMLHTPHSCICVKENFVQLPKHISIVCSSNVHNGIAFWNNTSHGLQYYILKESGFSQKLYEFCQFLENGNMAWSQEETLDIIRNMIVEYGGTL